MATKRSNESLLKRLRPRRNKVNYCDDSKLLQQHVPSEHHDSIVLLERIDSDNIKKPVYKTVKTSDLSDDKNDVYNFKYDRNDPKEKLVKKKKKRNVKVKNKTTKRSVRKKVTVSIKKVDNNKAGKSSDPNTNYSVKVAQYPLEPAAALSPLPESTEKDVAEVIEKLQINDQIIEEISLPEKPADKPSAEQIKKQDVKKPRIISIENADNIIITKDPPGSSRDPVPFRPSSNIPNNRSMLQYKNLLNSSLLMKSLSPISKEYDTFDPGSPWRPPQLSYTFSRCKHFVQSTPNVAKTDTIYKKRLMQVKDDSHNTDVVANVSDAVLKNVNSVQNISDNKVSHKKNPNPSRKFGTEITNIEHLSNCSTIQDNNVEVNEKSAVGTETNSITNVQLDTIASPLLNPPFDDEDDKENMAANHQTPKKSKKKLKRRQLPNSSPSKVYEIQNITQSENINPQPGPSGMKDSENCDQQKILRQSNLNNFLNLVDMPENTRIGTKHGIFDDVNSSPVSSSAIKKLANPAIGDLENAFGFCEKDTELDTSPIKDNPKTNQVSTKIQTKKVTSRPAPVRLPLGEVKDNLLEKRPNKKLTETNNKQTIKQKNIEMSKPLEEKKDNQLIDIVNFSDTFDIMSDSERPESTFENVPLFMDLEPSHFSKPPQHSYKRKRAVAFNFSDDSEKEEKEEKEIKTRKKKKSTKLEKENKKRLDEWVKTVNTTFQEIDEYNLLIE